MEKVEKKKNEGIHNQVDSSNNELFSLFNILHVVFTVVQLVQGMVLQR